MDFYEVLEKRRTCRDFSDREVSDEILKKVIDAAFKAPTNDHLRQLEFIVVRGRESITKVIAPLAKNMAAFRKLVFEVDESGACSGRQSKARSTTSLRLGVRWRTCCSPPPTKVWERRFISP